MTPMLQQYLAIKKSYPEVILFFRLGDFYEMFFEDAQKASRILDITLTSRESGKGNRIPMCGIPYHAAKGYINRLTREGLKVAICEQVEDPRATKELVKREVIRVITPGTNIEDETPEVQGENFIAGLYQGKAVTGLAYLNLGTGTFRVTELRHPEDVFGECARINPCECVISESVAEESALHCFLKKDTRAVINSYEEWVFSVEYASGLLKEQFGLASLEGLGLEGYGPGIAAAGAIIHYLRDTLHRSLAHLKPPLPYSSREFMLLDRKTQRNLELLDPISGEKGEYTLFRVLNKTVTPMGARLLRRWIKQPLIVPESINARLDAVDELVQRRELLAQVRDALKDIQDLERVVGHLSCGVGSARDLVALRDSLEKVPNLKSLLGHYQAPLLNEQRGQLHELTALVELITRAIVDTPPAGTNEGGMVRSGYHQELDELREVSLHGKDWLVKLQQREVNRTGIKSLKVRYNRVFGYYIEVTRANLHQVPQDYIRRQTLVNAERFVLPELQEYEEKILGAEARACEIELEIFEQVRRTVLEHVREIQEIAEGIAGCDVLAAFAVLALHSHYVRPLIDRSAELSIRGGRHPVVERVLEEGAFVENDTYLNQQDHQLLVLTGPNMAGKSTYLRQVALIVLMAQIGCFVPASAAHIGVTDRIFTRIGASDNLARGESTFMVEMIETAHILNNMSEKSLVILDEIGRGTSTFDGISIAWAVCEHLGREDGPRPKTLFATHYHELTGLEKLMPGVKSYTVSVKEYQDEVVFLRTIVPGSADRSYGIHVGKLAGLPQEVVRRAQELLAQLEDGAEAGNLTLRRGKIAGSDGREHAAVIPLLDRAKESPGAEPTVELPLFRTSRPEHPLLTEIKELDLQNMTPLEALNRLNELQEKAKVSLTRVQSFRAHLHS